jgi:hypothetical protein
MWPDNLDAVSAKRLPYALETIALARECNVPGPLKRAFYELLRTPEFFSAEGFRALSLVDIHCLHRARNRLVSSWTAATISPPTSFTCSNHPLTDTHKAIWYAAVLQSGIFQDYLYDPICGLDEVLLGINWDEELNSTLSCETCNKGRRETWLKQKVELWKKLDGWLELSEP